MNLFDFTPYHEPHIGPRGKARRNDGPRQPHAQEIRAYLDWLAERDGVHVPPGAEYHLAGIWSRAECRYIVAMPGYGQAQVATCEVLDDAGNVVRTMALPQDKRGGIPATAKQVRDWCGLEPVKAKRGKRAAALEAVSQDCPPTRDEAPAQGGQDAKEAPAPTCGTSSPVCAPEPALAPETAVIEPVSNPDKLPASIDLDDIAARVAALEQTIAALSVARTGTPTADAAPASTHAKRTPAHERAIRRAWAERKARRAAEVEIAQLEVRYARATDAAALAQQGEAAAMRNAEAFARRGVHHLERRRAMARRARRMIAEARGRADLERRALAAANVALTQLRQAMADPSQPERASDLARLVRERDQARTALAAVTARADREGAALAQLAGQFEAMVSRVTRAEAAMRKLGIAA
ncbi:MULTISPECIES: hypothetical protein [unclassified Novosphingobium]|uniref:hypothetical protein n=1 Tax=unclassified Novosphingobium TaxID=2644732 RepID=UPI000D3117FE|nr:MULTISPECIES: hypothetical protein [unclassified Novosphingobium]PTR08658.1 hypothetical protein C8K11_111104 [Novosphingobium sp. GV055]PUB01381.1 hypothetical protein C8K12_111104 [Novosphingobium sp. GV061]PUB16955.1 hypothetical protein C8K14_111104 [Novosphingobium sp. GV079]PUB39978.1 hypothetical protein C8K10_111104 [Novosphingobium sp. GV027]